MKYFEIDFPKSMKICRQYGGLLDASGKLQMPWDLSRGRAFEGTPFESIQVTSYGKAPDFARNSLGVVIASRKALAVLDAFNIKMETQVVRSETGDEVVAVNVLDVVECIDMSRSKYDVLDDAGSARRWEGRDGDIEGMYQLVLRDDVDIRSDLFRVFGWRVALLASDHLRLELLRNCRCDVKFSMVPRGTDWDAGFPCPWREYELRGKRKSP
jgi:hypothetical protein